jgi:hypothetical protein
VTFELAPGHLRMPPLHNCLVVLLSGGMNSTTTPRWPLERVLFALAGSVTLITVALAATVSPWFLLMTGFVGVSQWLYVLVGACPASLVIRRVWRLQSAVYPKETAR